MDELERRIRAARPTSVDQNTPLSGRAKQELAELIQSTPDHLERINATSRTARRTSRRRTWIAGGVLAPALVACVALVVMLIGQPLTPGTPDIRIASPVSESAHEALLAASRAAAKQVTTSEDSDMPSENSELPSEDSSPTQPQVISVQTWSSAEPDRAVAMPEHRLITIDADGNRVERVTAAQSVEPESTVVADSNAPAEGALLREHHYRPGEFPYEFEAPAPTSADELAKYLRVAVDLDQSSSASKVIQAIETLLTEQSLTPSQAAALLEYLAHVPGLELAGATSDRLGRAALMFVATDGDYEVHLFVSPTIGQILAIEHIYSGSSRTDITAPAVLSYHAWSSF